MSKALRLAKLPNGLTDSGLPANRASVVSSDITMQSNFEYYVKTASAVVNLTLPLNMVDGDTIIIYRYGSNFVNILRNGYTINYIADDVRMDTNRSLIQLKYFDGNVIAIPGVF